MAPPEQEAERRQLTVMFCDLVCSTALSERVDPEDLRDLVRGYQDVCAEVIQRYDGHIAQYLGDGLLVYFGYPHAHEDDAQRAIRAGLGVVDATLNLPDRLPGRLTHPLQVRIGIHTGLVVVGEVGGGGRHAQLALGDTPNIAARLQALAEPNTVVVSGVTHRLAAGLFEYRDLGPQALKGISTPLRVYQVLQETEARSRFEAAVKRGLLPLVGREEEFALLRRRWDQAKDGAGQAIFLSGEMGIGKSRLVQALKEQVSAEGGVSLELRCSAYHQNSAFHPLIEHLLRVMRVVPHDSPQDRLVKLQQTLARCTFPQADTLALFASLLSLPHPQDAPPITLSPQKQRQRTQEALVAWIVEEAEHTPVCCVWEDLHWADPSTLDLLGLHLDRVPATRQLALLTFRADFTPPWPTNGHRSQLALTRLDEPKIAALVEHLTLGKSLPADVQQHILHKTDGIPLFVEELTKMVLESGIIQEAADRYELTGTLSTLAIPSTLQDSLMARLDRLAPVKSIAQVGAAVGREFSYEVLQAILPLDDAVLQQGLQQLLDAELIFQRGVPPQATYIFKHALVQDVAYQSLLKRRRQQLHGQIAEVLEDRFPEIHDTQPELLAHHFTEAGRFAEAIAYWLRAGQRALQRSANIEATRHVAKGLDLLPHLPDGPDRTQQELKLQSAAAMARMAVKGYGFPDVGRIYTRALELAQQLGDTPQVFALSTGLLRYHYVRADLQTAGELGEECLRLAPATGASGSFVAAHTLYGATLFYLGDLLGARGHFEQAMTLYDLQQHRDLAILYGTDSGVVCSCYWSNLLWYLGYPDQALQKSRETLALAQERNHLVSLAGAWHFASLVHQFRREGQAAMARGEAAYSLSTEKGYLFFASMGAIDRGWALADQGHRDDGIEQMRQGIAAYQATGARLWLPYFLALLAEAYARVDRVDDGLRLLAEALEIIEKTGEHSHEAELHRLRGELMLARDPDAEDDAATSFQKAIDIARGQQAKSWELRAATSLARLWRRQGQSASAREILAEIYGWFSEGFDTADLKEAEALLGELT